MYARITGCSDHIIGEVEIKYLSMYVSSYWTILSRNEQYVLLFSLQAEMNGK
jgi:hypothetical protein